MPIFPVSKLTGQITITTGAEAVAGPDVETPNGVMVRALSSNGGSAWWTNVGNDEKGEGDDITGVGFELTVVNPSAFPPVANLNQLLFGGSGNGYVVCWAKL